MPYAELTQIARFEQVAIPAGGSATADVAKTLAWLFNMPVGADQKLFLFWGTFTAADAGEGSSTNYHTLNLYRRGSDPDGDDTLIATHDFKADGVQWQDYTLTGNADALTPLSAGDRILYEVVHTGTTTAAFPGGVLALSFTGEEIGDAGFDWTK